VVVTIGHDGTVDVHLGLVLPEDARKAKAAAKSADDKPKGIVLSAALVEDLTAHKTAAIGAELIRQPDVALAAMVHALTLGTLYQFATDHSCLKVRTDASALRIAREDADTPSGLAAVDVVRADWSHRLPESPHALWQWCLTQTRDTLLDLLAFIAANLVDGIERKHDRADSPRLHHGDALASALQIDMAKWFVPTASNYFGRVSRDAIIEAMTQAKGTPAAPSWAKMKKAELAAQAERQTAGTGWLPKAVSVAPAIESAAASADDEHLEAAE
jgi:ParB family chromosome partitioning protein